MNSLRYAAAAGLSLALLVPMAPASAAVVGDTPAVSASFNGTVRAVVVRGTRAFVAGDFTTGTDATGTRTRNHLAAVDLRTGRLTSWNPSTNGAVRALAVSNGAVYAGGDFTSVDGVAVLRLARISARNGNVVKSFRPALNNSVRALTIARSRLFVGGDFTSVNGKPRTRLAAMTRASGSLLGWKPSANARVLTLEHRRGLVFAGGFFTKVNRNTKAHRLTALSIARGTVSRAFRSPTTYPVTDLVVTRRRVYVAGAGAGGHVKATNAAGKRLWQKTFDGDVNALAVLSKRLYVGGHYDYLCATARVGQTNGDCRDAGSAVSRRLSVFTRKGSLINWNPKPNSNVGVLALAGSRRYGTLAVGGDFDTWGGGTTTQRKFALLK